MSHYINPAFCQKSEFCPRMSSSTSSEANIQNRKLHNTVYIASRNDWNDWNDRCIGGLEEVNRNCEKQFKLTQQRKQTQNSNYFDVDTKCEENVTKCLNTTTQPNTSGYALVPLEELPSTSKNRYAIVPPTEAHILCNSSLRLTKSQDDLDVLPELGHEGEDSFTSLPAFIPQEDSRKLFSAFSSDFINKSMILVDQNSLQRYTIVPTDDDEEVVDSNHEIIEMHNGRVHRYAVIPTDDDGNVMNQSNVRSNNLDNSPVEIGCSKKFEKQHKLQPKFMDRENLTTPDFSVNRHIQTRMCHISNTKGQATKKYDESRKKLPGTPTKNPIATQKLHELLSTPRKCMQETLQRQGSYQTIIQNQPNQFQLQQLYSTQEQIGFMPQKQKYENRNILSQNIEQRTTAVISPRLHQQAIYNDTTLDGEKSWTHETYQKVENAAATIGIISLMLILTGVLNSGLCLYMITDVSECYFFIIF